MTDQEDTSRKPVPAIQREPAQDALNRFLQEKGIMIGTQSGEISTTNNGAIVIAAPKVIAVYADSVGPKKAPGVN